MPLCDACQILADGDGNDPSHEALKQTGQNVIKPLARPKIIITDYSCQICGTVWTRTDDRDERFKAWSQAPS
jgi:5-methylcytosine-specific restriction endonuclease McrA